MARRPEDRQRFSILSEAGAFAKHLGMAAARGVGRVLAIGVGGTIFGAVCGGGVAIYYQLPFLLSIGIGAIVGLVVVFALMILVAAEY